MALVIKGSSSGQITLDVPSASGTNTISLPASTGTVALTSQLAGFIIKVHMMKLQQMLQAQVLFLISV